MTEAVIFDCGSGFSKIGYSGAKAPSAVFPTVVGLPRNVNKASEKRGLRAAVGDAALGKDARMMGMVYPIQHGAVADWAAMESVWEYIVLNHLMSPIEDTPLLLSETPMNSKKNRERTVETMFETYKPPCVYLALKPVLSMYAHGDTTGCVLQSGDDVTHALCVKDGYAVSGTVVKSGVSGRTGTAYLKQALQARGESVSDGGARLLKERCGAVSSRYSAEPTHTTSFALPDGQRFEVGKERFTVAEANFDPNCVGGRGTGFADCIIGSINNCHENGLKKKMYDNIVLGGGNTMYRFTDKRLTSSLIEVLGGRDIKPKVVAAHDRKHYSWLGGSVITSLSTFRAMWITEQDYKENGPNIVSQKCPFYAQGNK